MMIRTIEMADAYPARPKTPSIRKPEQTGLCQSARRWP